LHTHCAPALRSGQKFTAKLNAKNGLGMRTYQFAVAKSPSKSGSYSSNMIKACTSMQMKPVCDHPSYCSGDPQALFIGQSGHLAYKPHRNNDNYAPGGFKSIRDKWNKLCSYTAGANGNYALCNIPVNSHSWKTPAQANPGFICGRGLTFSGTLGGKNGAAAQFYDFEVSPITGPSSHR
jgi:hypothetical protein